MEVERYKFGKTTVIVDDACIKYVGKEQVKPVLDRVAQTCYEDAMRKEKKKIKGA